MDDNLVTSPREISANIPNTRARKTIPVQIVRDKRELTIQLTVEDPASDSHHAVSKRR